MPRNTKIHGFRDDNGERWFHVRWWHIPLIIIGTQRKPISACAAYYCTKECTMEPAPMENTT